VQLYASCLHQGFKVDNQVIFLLSMLAPFGRLHTYTVNLVGLDAWLL
jgi:hypothetical protein